MGIKPVHSLLSGGAPKTRHLEEGMIKIHPCTIASSVLECRCSLAAFMVDLKPADVVVL